MKRQNDWRALRLEFIQGDESLHEFSQKHGLGRTWLYHRAEREGWQAEREKYRRLAREKATQRLAADYAARTAKYARINEDILANVQRMLDDTKGPDGEILQPLEPSQLRDAAKAVEIALKNDRLLCGEATEINKGDTESLHVSIVRVIEAMEKDPNILDKVEMEAI